MRTKLIDWNIFGQYIEALIYSVKLSGERFDAIIGIPRGGLIPAVFLSHALKVPMVTNLDTVHSGQKILIVDEICDTGKTLMKVAEYNNHYVKSSNVCYTYVALVKRTDSKFDLDFWADEVDKGILVIFPWESITTAAEVPASWRE